MINIAIDGTAGSGKSALAKGIAKALNIKRLNTGEIYRAIACEYLSKIGENLDNKNVSLFCQNLKIEVLFKDERQITLVNGNDHTKSLREEKTSIFTAQIAKFKEIRQKVLAIQRDFAKKYDCVMEGRDIGREFYKNHEVIFEIEYKNGEKYGGKKIYVQGVEGKIIKSIIRHLK